MKFKNVKVGAKVRVKITMTPDRLAFYTRHRGNVGTVLGDPDEDGDVRVKFSDGTTDIGHYSNLKRIKE